VDGEAWAVLTGSGEVRTGDDRHISVGTAPLRLVSTPDGVWVSVITDGKLVRIDPATGKVDLRVTLSLAGSEPEGLAYDGSWCG
jgi:streptogramin lyase